MLLPIAGPRIVAGPSDLPPAVASSWPSKVAPNSAELAAATEAMRWCAKLLPPHGSATFAEAVAQAGSGGASVILTLERLSALARVLMEGMAASPQSGAGRELDADTVAGLLDSAGPDEWMHVYHGCRYKVDLTAADVQQGPAHAQLLLDTFCSVAASMQPLLPSAWGAADLLNNVHTPKAIYKVAPAFQHCACMLITTACVVMLARGAGDGSDSGNAAGAASVSRSSRPPAAAAAAAYVAAAAQQCIAAAEVVLSTAHISACAPAASTGNFGLLSSMVLVYLVLPSSHIRAAACSTMAALRTAEAYESSLQVCGMRHACATMHRHGVTSPTFIVVCTTV